MVLVRLSPIHLLSNQQEHIYFVRLLNECHNGNYLIIFFATVLGFLHIFFFLPSILDSSKFTNSMSSFCCFCISFIDISSNMWSITFKILKEWTFCWIWFVGLRGRNLHSGSSLSAQAPLSRAPRHGLEPELILTVYKEWSRWRYTLLEIYLVMFISISIYVTIYCNLIERNIGILKCNMILIVTNIIGWLKMKGSINFA